ncbi:MAG: hypothetical protein V8R67_01850 [Eubacterium sp.]
MNNEYSVFTAKAKIGDQTVALGELDYSIHDTHFAVKIDGTSSALSRTVTISNTDAADSVLNPGANKSIYVAAWPEGSDESAASVILAKTAYTEGGMTATASLAATANTYGNWNAKLVFEAANGTTTTLARDDLRA